MKSLSGMFDKWMVDEEKGLLFDDGNNIYSIGEIRSLHFQKQLHNTLIGNQYNVLSLKSELEDKIKNVPCPTIKIDWGDGTTQTIKHPKFG